MTISRLDILQEEIQDRLDELYNNGYKQGRKDEREYLINNIKELKDDYVFIDKLIKEILKKQELIKD